MAVMKFLVYVTCFFLSQDLVFCDDYGESGNKITLTPSIRGNPEEILWTHNGNKVLEYDGSEVAKYGSFKDRVDVDFETGQLTIRKLNSQDSGKYQSEIWINRKVQISRHTLTVLDALPEPQVTCELNETSNLKKLSCSVESQTRPSYEWSGPDIKHSGPTLLVKEQEENRNSVYTCTVKNKAGSRTTDFTLQDCDTVWFAGGVSLAVLVPVLIVILLLIILLAVLALYLYRRKKQKWKSGLKTMDLENGECNSLLRNLPMEAMPGSFEATLPCHIRLTAPKESIADKKWDQDSESENAGETCEGQKLLKESPQSAITEENKDDTGNTNEGELYKNEKNRENADEEEENTNSKADETDTEVESQHSLQAQEEMEKSQILKNESEDEEESPQEQIETLGEQDTKDAETNEDDQKPEEKKEKEEENKETDSLNTAEEELEKNQNISENADEAEENTNSKADETDTEVESQNSLQAQEEMEKSQILKNESEDKEESPQEQIETLGEQDTKDAETNEDDQKPEEKKEKEEENEEIDSLNTVDTGNVAEQLHKNDKSRLNENGDQSIEQQNKSLCTSVNENNQRSEGEKEEEEKTEKKNHEGTGRLHTAEPFNPPLHSEAPSDPVDSPSNLYITVPSSNLNMELENKQAAFFPQEEDDDGEQTDKSSESEHGMKEKKDGPEIKETKNKLLKECDVKNSDPDNTNNDVSVPEDKKAETETNSFSKHAMKEDHSSEIREQYLNK
ncbi:lymphocyte function-associated antigen 3 isoform X2 [Onychostoma macrolepis]|uniref:lymphocyte function-associated antigen 3 isoform X2 n=1 Tax=Onychostoma macrolepis TaxID=369639 RepID=UPI0027295250|nr:lymphocyte function-associated antigen 3 isoform X2 [Onychostoma macrolepis]